MKKPIFIITLFFPMLFSSYSHTLTLKNYEELKEDPTTSLYIFAVAQGISYTNVMFTQRGDKPLYCAPQNLALQEENYVDILDRIIAELPDSPEITDNLPTEGLLLQGLVSTFPCDENP